MKQLLQVACVFALCFLFAKKINFREGSSIQYVFNLLNASVALI